MPGHLSGCVFAMLVLLPATVRAGCDKDADCKGDRICVSGECTAPPQAAQPVLLAPAPQATPFAPTAMSLTPAHVSALREAGCALDPADAALADRLARRGFGPEEFVAAYQATRLLKVSYPRAGAYPRDLVEVVAIGQRLKLEVREIYRFASGHFESNLPLTEAYNRKLTGNRRRTVAGAILSGLGAAMVGGGVAFKVVAMNEHEQGRSDDTASMISWAFFGLGGAALIAGIPTLIVGLARDGGRPRLEDGALDGDGPLRVDSDAERGLEDRLVVSPFVTRGGAGASLALTF